MTARELASIFAISPKTIYSYAERNVIPNLKIEGSVRFREHASLRQREDGLSQRLHPNGWGFRGLEGNVSALYRIEIDIRIDNRTRTKVIQAAREDYRKTPFAWTLETASLWKSQQKNSSSILRRRF
jgi:hypothetical protein